MKQLVQSICIVLLLCGCHHYAVRVDSGAVPGASPQKSDPVFLELPEQSTIMERQLEPVLRKELEKNGFNLVGNETEAQWIMVLYSSSERMALGSTSHGVGIPIGNSVVVKQKSKIQYGNEITINLALYPGVEFIGGKQRSIWDGSATVNDAIYSHYTKGILKNLLDVYGTTYSDNRILSKSYESAEQP